MKYDFIIIGTGAGGGTLAANLAPTGKNILILERGDYVPREKENWDTEEVFVKGRYKANEPWIDGNGEEFHPGIHYCVGGNTKFYGAALLRMREEDFGELEHHDGVSPAWPISYGDLKSYYQEAEEMYHVHGERGSDPTEPYEEKPYPEKALPHEPRIQELFDDIKELGLKPFPLPIGVKSDTKLGDAPFVLDRFDGFPDPTESKADSHIVGVKVALEYPNVTLKTNAEVTKLVTGADGKKIEKVAVSIDGENFHFESETVIVACGAINSAALLLKSKNDKHPNGLANSSDLVGRNYMSHNNSAMIALSKKPNPTKFGKTFAVNDFYFKDDKGFELVQDAEGNYVIIGQTNSFNNIEDVLLLKVDSKGSEIWQKTYGGPLNDRGFGVTIAKNGDYLLVGRTELAETESTNVYLLRTDADGNLLWEQNFGGDALDIGESVIETSDGNIVIVGSNRSSAIPNPTSPSGTSSDVYFIKTDASGNILIEKTYGNVEEDGAYDVVETAEGNFVLTGITSNKRDLYLLSLDKTGAEIWSKSYGGDFDEIGNAIAITPDGGFIVAGVKEITTTTSQMYLVKTDNQGNLEWERLFGLSGLDFGQSVAVTNDGGYIIGGGFDINNDPDRPTVFQLYDMYMVKTDGNGNIFNNTIRGTVHRDMNTNCEKDENEAVLEDWLVRIRNGNEVFYATTDENGEYELTVENGNYNVSLVILNTAWEVCQNYNVLMGKLINKVKML